MPEPDLSSRRTNVRLEQAGERIYRLLVDAVKDYSIFLIGSDGRIVTWNEGARRIKGYEAKEIIGQAYEKFFTPEDRANGKPQRLLAQALSNGSTYDEGWRLRKDGSRFWASATLTAIQDDDGTHLGFAKVTHDDTRKHEAVEALTRSEERFRLSVNAMREQAFYMLDPNGMVESWNPGAERIKGYKASEIIGQHFSIFFTDDDKVANRPGRELDLAAKVGSFEEEGWRIRKDGTRFWASVMITAVYDARNQLRGFTKVTRDDTAKHQASVQLQQALERARDAEIKLREYAAELEKRVEERTAMLTRQTDTLQRTNAELEQFAYIASHDLKEPLRMITNYLDLLRTKYTEHFDARALGYFEKVTTAANRMGELVEAVLEYSREETGTDHLDVVSSRAAAETAIANLQSAITESGAKIAIDELPAVRANPVHLTRLFQNLIANAVKFHSDRPLEVNIQAQAVGDEWVFSIADNGIGIDPRYHSRLFKIFQRLHRAEEYAGSGIGLASCKKILDRLGGRIWVESAEGIGSTFKFSLPRAG